VPSVRVDDIDIWYELAGDGPLLTLTHGFAGPTSHWGPIIDDFRAKFRLLLYDVRGHGRTSLPDASTFSLPRFAADLRGLLDALGIAQTHIGGVSMGGMISAQFACDYPERTRSLLLCDTTAGNQVGAGTAAGRADAQLAVVFDTFQAVVKKHGLRGLIERENRHRHEDDPYAARSTQSLEEQDAGNWRKLETMTEAGYLAAAAAIRNRPDLTSRTPSLTMPALVSCGEWDMFWPCAERDHALIRGSRLAKVPGAAHATPDYQPRRWRDAVFSFIDDVEAGRPVAGEVVAG